VTLSARDSRDPDGRIVGFAWSFGDGQRAEGQDVSHAYAAPGLYELALLADDGTGLANAKKQSVLRLRVNRPPRAEAGPDRMVCPGEEVTFDAASSIDWDDELVGYRWEFGDGTVAEGQKVTHRFATPGVHDARLTVIVGSGSGCAAATDEARVVVNAPPVAKVNGDREGFVGGAHDQLLFDASASEDADGHPLSFRWDLGDGVVLAGDRVRHGYAQPGTYPVRLTVSDGSGLACGQITDTVEVAVRRRD
jgi:PKD repeat protein